MKKFITTFFVFFLIINLYSQTVLHEKIIPNVKIEMVGADFGLNLSPIDLNNDGINDVAFRWDSIGGEWYFHIYKVNNNQTIDFLVNPPNINDLFPFLKPLVLNNTISDSDVWGLAIDSEPFIGNYENDNFNNLGDRYIGIKLFNNNGTHNYAWILVDFSNKILTVKEYAYNTISGTPLTIQNDYSNLSTKNINNFDSENSFYFINKHNYFVVNDLEHFNYYLYNTSGKLLQSKQSKNNQKNYLKGLSQGNYIIVVEDIETKNRKNKKIVIN